MLVWRVCGVLSWDGNARLWPAGLRGTLSSFWVRLWTYVALDLWRTRVMIGKGFNRHLQDCVYQLA